MTPYYQDAAVTIYYGDCRDVLPTLPRADLVLTDPPYGLASWTSTGGNSISASEADDVNRWDQRLPADLMRLAVAAGRYAIVWGGNYYNDILGPTRAPLVWDKAQRGMHFADGEMAWTNFDFGTLRILNLPIVAGSTYGKKQHPTEKPEGVMTWCLARVPKTRTVIDPFMGSGTTLVAVKRSGLTAVGVELDERYCEVAARRLSQGVLSDLFRDPMPAGDERVMLNGL